MRLAAPTPQNRLWDRFPTGHFLFWQRGGGFDRNIFREKTLPAVIGYVHANPVRRGLVEHPTDWQWSSARFCEAWPNVPIRMDDPFG